MTPFTIVATIMTFLWPFATSKGALVAIAVIYGCVDYAIVVCHKCQLSSSFSCGTYVSLFSVPAISMGAIGGVGRRVGLFLSFAALGALAGPPISGAINSATEGFKDVGWYAGKCSKYLCADTFSGYIRGNVAALGVLLPVDAVSSSRQVDWQVLMTRRRTNWSGGFVFMG